ncbi:MAG TPA: alkaline phosphatase family protein [Candidatus Limnocylindria bacterium]|nr:alkaline phosphatase family protein [Candidatus Limnocylindria bacterium]
MTPAAAAPLPAFGRSTLAEVAPSLLAALGSEEMPNPLGLEPMRLACLLLVDGFGWRALEAHRDEVPFLASLMSSHAPIQAPFPSSTAVSITSLSTGRPPGEHGITGYTMAMPGLAQPMNCIGWSVYGTGEDLRRRFPPAALQPHATLLETAAQHGLGVAVLSAADHAGSGLSIAALRGAEHVAVGTPEELVENAPAVAARIDRGVVYAYLWQVDLAGHVHGAASAEWLRELVRLDRALERLAAALAKHDTALLITGDHGMIDVPEAGKIDAPADRDLMRGVRIIAGEPRARHLHTAAGAADDVLAAWRERVGGHAWIVGREEAITAGWFGPVVNDDVRPRIGDVIVAARDPIGIFQRRRAPREWRLVGHHGSLTAEEQLVPLLIHAP